MRRDVLGYYESDYESVVVNSSRWLDTKDLLNEVWADIDGYEGLYKISNYGRVKSLGHKPRYKNIHDRILRPGKNSNNYYVVVLYKDKQKKTKKVHILVAKAFISNPYGRTIVDHYYPVEKDYCNNCLYNLRWCTIKENVEHSIELGRNSKPPIYKKTSRNHHSSKPVIQFDKLGNFIKQWYCPADVERELGYSRHAIYDCCNGKTKTSNGFVWVYGIYNEEVRTHDENNNK